VLRHPVDPRREVRRHTDDPPVPPLDDGLNG
jgi:hypothetical protein